MMHNRMMNLCNIADLRVFPTFVVNLVLVGGFLVSCVNLSGIKDLCLVEQFMMEAKRLFVFGIHGS
jgi:hypothetical protein